MIDNISSTLENVIITPEEKPFEYKGFLFTPKFNNKTGDLIASIGNVKNLRVTFYYDKIIVQNSLHKFYHGNNFGDFNYSDLEISIFSLDDFFEGQYLVGTPTQLEYGVNIADDEALKDVLSWSSFKNKPSVPIESNSNIYGSKIKRTKYGFKGYDKTFEVKKTTGIYLPEKITRIEGFAKMNYLNSGNNGISVNSMADLLNKDNLRALGYDLANKLSQVDKRLRIDYSSLTVAQTKTITSWLDNESRAHIKSAITPRQFRRYKKEAQDILSSNHSDYDLSNAIRTKFNELISNV